LKDDKAGKLDLFKDIMSAKKKKGAEEEEEEEEEVDSKRTKKKMDAGLVLQMPAPPIPVSWLPNH
jgi:hypothetical protein